MSTQQTDQNRALEGSAFYENGIDYTGNDHTEIGRAHV